MRWSVVRRYEIEKCHRIASLEFAHFLLALAGGGAPTRQNSKSSSLYFTDSYDVTFAYGRGTVYQFVLTVEIYRYHTMM
jgi:hypothetical protein